MSGQTSTHASTCSKRVVSGSDAIESCSLHDLAHDTGDDDHPDPFWQVVDCYLTVKRRFCTKTNASIVSSGRSKHYKRRSSILMTLEVLSETHSRF